MGSARFFERQSCPQLWGFARERPCLDPSPSPIGSVRGRCSRPLILVLTRRGVTARPHAARHVTAVRCPLAPSWVRAYPQHVDLSPPFHHPWTQEKRRSALITLRGEKAPVRSRGFCFWGSELITWPIQPAISQRGNLFIGCVCAVPTGRTTAHLASGRNHS